MFNQTDIRKARVHLRSADLVMKRTTHSGEGDRPLDGPGVSDILDWAAGCVPAR
jgi:hypothetical protein